MSGLPLVSRAIVRRVWSETPGLVGVVLEVSEDVARTYERPGQFLVARPGGDERVHLVIASRPGEASAFEVLLGASARAKLAIGEGSEGRVIEIEAPQGAGYPIDLARGRDVFLLAMGSGLASLRPVIELMRLERESYGRVTAYIGAHTVHDFPYAGHYELWARDRIDIIRVVSKPWVQDRLDGDRVSVENAVAFICGSKAMMESTTRVLVGKGLPLERIRRNW